MKKVKAPKARNVQPVILTMDALIDLVNKINEIENKINEIVLKYDEMIELSVEAYPERTLEGLKFKYFTEDGNEDFISIKI